MRQYITRRVALLVATVLFALSVPLAVFASHQFTDVPNSNIFHADIDALADSGVTTGCSATRYCPNDFVTRGQMAAFLNRLGALAPGKTPVVNATRLDGVDSSGFVRYGATVPGNTLITGVFSTAGTAAAGGEFAFSDITFVVPLNGAPTPHIIPPATAPPAGCSGSVSSPSASSGHLCIFIGSQANASELAVGNPINGATGSVSSRGAALRATATAAGSYGYVGTWAARSPLTLSPEQTDAAGSDSLFTP